MAAKGKGYGKVILFGEHFVVYGLPAIASAISNHTLAIVEPGSKGLEFIDERPSVEGYKETKKQEIQRELDAITKVMSIDVAKTPLKITLTGNLKAASGIGASAALATSIARALSNHFDLKFNDAQINEVAFEAEKAGSGTPSGIDNTVSTFGGMISFEKNMKGGKNEIEHLKLKVPLRIVLASTGISQETKKVVEDMRRAKEKNPEKFLKIFKDYGHLYEEALDALAKGDLKKTGKFMSHNQKLLEEIGLSCPEIEELVETAVRHGALGAKLTGTGRGGLVMCLVDSEASQDKVFNAIRKKGFEAEKTELGARAKQ